MGLETGNPDIRNGILHKPTDNKVYINAFKLFTSNDEVKNRDDNKEFERLIRDSLYV